jgi:P-type Cu2+ transporter
MSCCVGNLAETYAANDIDVQRIEEIKAGGQRLANGAMVYGMSVPAIHCGACVSAIERALIVMPGVTAARVNLSLRCLMLTVSPGFNDPAPFVRKLRDLGYPPISLSEAVDGKGDLELKFLTRSLAVAGFAAANIMLLSVSVWTGAEGATRDLFHFVSALIAIPAVAYAGQPFFRSALRALSHRRMNMDVPISLGVLLATAMSLFESLRGGEHAYFDAAVSLLFFLLIGRTLDHMMRGRARQLVSGLARISAKGGMVVSADGALRYMALEDIQPGMLLRVAAGERIPVDGTVEEGISDIDRSLVTGESAPVPMRGGGAVEAGSMNLTGALDVRATRYAKDSFLSDVLRMMAAAEQGRGTYVRMADRMAAIYAPSVHVLALASFLGWMLWTGGDWHLALTVAISVLIITCPCALGLAVPVAHVVSASRLFQAGILMKDGSALERMAEINHVAFDKTGTLTTGEAQVAQCSIPGGELSNIAASLARRSRHPASLALVRHFAGLPDVNLENVKEEPGNGIEAGPPGRRFRLGRGSWVAEISSDEAGGVQGLAFAAAGGPCYGVKLGESLRPGAGATIGQFKQRGIGCEILSGDASSAVCGIAARLGVDSFKSGLRPGDKHDRLVKLAADGHKVLMVGDGLNDAPSLAAAHVSMAPSSASDIGRNVADFIFTRENMSALTVAYDIAVCTQAIVRQNFGLAIAYNVLAVPLAIAGYLNPLIAAVAMSTSSIIVVGNSLRLLKTGSGQWKQGGTRQEEASMARELKQA